jgi:hypothetical protein
MERLIAGYDISDSASTVRRGRGKMTRLGIVEMKETTDPQATGEARRILAKGLLPAKAAYRSIRRAPPSLGGPRRSAAERLPMPTSRLRTTASLDP